MRIIAFGHRSRVGKDTCGSFLQTMLLQTNRYRVVKTSFAHRLKQACASIWGWAGVKSPEYYEQNPEKRLVVIPELGITVVDLWIKFGTPMCRDMVHNGTWVNNLLLTPPVCDVLIITDLRFPNEGAAIHDMQGICVHIEKPDAPIRNSVADVALEDWQYWNHKILNTGSLRELYHSVEMIAQKESLL